MKKILVTGGAGYIGAHTAVELIQNGYEVILIDDFSKSDSSLLEGMQKITKIAPTFYEGNCSDVTFLRHVFNAHSDISCALHFAAYKAVGESVEQPLLYYRNNIDSLLSLLQVMKEFDISDLIFSSSCTVYGQPDQIPVSEEAPFKPAESPYGSTKQMCEKILQDVYRTGFRIISLRYFNPIGAHPSALMGELPIGAPNNLVPYITQTAAGVRSKLTVFGNDYNTPDGSCLRDFIHVGDLATAHVGAMEFLQTVSERIYFDAFNIGTGHAVSVLQLLDEFTKVNNVQVNFTIGPRRSGDVEKIYANPSKSEAILKWKPKYSIQDSLVHAWQWEKKIRQIE